ncbi:hypothetical protein [Pantoea septica]|uniref:hypothetical protein n=1 Tax=Pantoea septica TaxID=472695 RepID=UPI0028A15F60|nr:hypothetical protein [Pantoea septica]
MARHILLWDWAKGPNGINPTPSKTTLSRMAKTKQFHPPALKMGSRWVIDENARFIGLKTEARISPNLPDEVRHLVERTVNGSKTA